MMTLLVAMIFQTISLNSDGPIHCDFPSTDGASKMIVIELHPRPSLKDQPGLYRVAMTLNGQGPLRASAQPITSTGERDMLIQGRSKRHFTYSLGLRADGKAALNISRPGASEDEVMKSTRTGTCIGHNVHMQRWLPL